MKDKYDSTGAMASAWFGTHAPKAVSAIFGQARSSTPQLPIPTAQVVPDGATVKLEWCSVYAAHNAKVGPLYTADDAVALAEWISKEMANALVVAKNAIHRADMSVKDRESALATIDAALKKPSLPKAIMQLIQETPYAGRIHRSGT